MNAQKQKGQALNAASAQKAIDILKVLLDSSFCLFALDIFISIQDEREGIRSQNRFCLIDINVHAFVLFCMASYSLYDVYNPYISGLSS